MDNELASPAAVLPAAAARPWRTIVIALTYAACVVAYSDRVNISVAAVAMREQYGWSQTEKGLVLSAFFIGYMVFMLASGWLATRFGGRRVLGLAVFTWSAFTFLTPPAASLSIGALIAARIGLGIGEAAMFPASYALYGRWVPLVERTRVVARLLACMPAGTVLGLLVTGWIVGRLGWPIAFYAFGALGLAWCVAWFRLVSDDPRSDRHVAAEEAQLLAGLQPDATAPAAVPWRRLLLRRPVAGMVCAHFASTWTLYVLLSWLPSYFREVLGLSLTNAGVASTAPWLAMFAGSVLAGAFSDRLLARGTSVTTTRKCVQCGGLLLSASCLLLARDVHAMLPAVLLMSGAAGALGLTFAGFAPNKLDLAPRFAGVLGGFSNTIATIPGIVGVAATGWLVDVTGTYTAGFVLSASVSLAGALAYAVLFDARPLLD